MLSEAATFFPGLLSRILTPFSSHWASSPAFLLLFSRKIKPTLKSPRPLPHFEGQTPKIGVRSAKWGRGAFRGKVCAWRDSLPQNTVFILGEGWGGGHGFDSPTVVMSCAHPQG